MTRLTDRLSNVGRESMLLAMGTAAVVVGQGAAAPVLPEYTISLGADPVGLAWAVAGFAIGRLVITLPTGIWEQRFSPRLVLTLGCMITAVGVIGTGLAPTFPIMIGTRALAGIGSGIFMTSAILTIVRNAPPESRARQIGFNQTALLGTVSVAPALGGFLGETFGLRASFIIVGVMSAIGGAAVWALLPWAYRGSPARPAVTADSDPAEGPVHESTASESQVDEGRFHLPGPLLWSSLVVAAVVNLMVFATRAGARQTVLPLIAVQEFGMTVGSLGALFTMMSVVSLVVLPLSSGLSDRFGRARTIIPAMVIAAVGLVIIPRSHVEWTLWFGAGLMALGTALGGPAPAAWAADLSPVSRQGIVMSSFRTAGDAGSIVGPVILGWIATLWGLGPAMDSQAVALAVVAALVLTVGVLTSPGGGRLRFFSPRIGGPQG